MPIPLLLAGGLFGAGAAAEAADKRDEGKRLQQLGEDAQRRAVSRWGAQWAKTDIDLQRYGRLKVDVATVELWRFAVAATALGLQDLAGWHAVDPRLSVLTDLRAIYFREPDGMLGRLCTGAAGAAAAGAATVLSGVVAGPALLVGGLIMDAQAEKALEAAKDYKRRLDENALGHDEATKALEAVARCAGRLTGLLEGHRKAFGPLLGAVEVYSASGREYPDLADHERDCVWLALEQAGLIRDLLQTPVAGADGTVNPDAEGLV